MDFILALTHFCEVHGPTSIICSQVLPFSCSQCQRDRSDFTPDDTPATSHDTGFSTPSRSGRKPSLPPLRTESSSGPANLGLSSPKIEDHPWFFKTQQQQQQALTDADRVNRFGGGSEGDTCASCSVILPEDVSKQLPPGAPGTPKRDGKGRNGSPVLRSREVVHSCSHSFPETEDSMQDPHIHASLPDSIHSSSTASDASSSCHTHVLTYLSLRGPPNPADYALLRRASIRTLSCELLPRGLSAGPLCFGDSVAGYTIAYIFRLPDPMARGKRRSYALVALAGKDANRAFRACPVIWRAFGRIASGTVAAAEKFQEEEKRREEQQQQLAANGQNNKIAGRAYTPVSSFLTGRTVDPDGHPRRPGPIRARNLTEIVGNQYIFAELHANFVALLQQLKSMFGGGVPLCEESSLSVYGSEPEEITTTGDGTAAKTPSLAAVVDPRSQSRRQERERPPVDTYSSSTGGGGGGGDGDMGMSSLHLSSTAPKPIPIAARRPVAA